MVRRNDRTEGIFMPILGGILMKIIGKDGTVRECENKEEELHILRHTAAHIMAQAIKRLYPQADFGYGPATEKGFYYDVDLGDTKLTDEDLPAIEAEMKKIIKEGNYKGLSVISEEQVIKAAETLLLESK